MYNHFFLARMQLGPFSPSIIILASHWAGDDCSSSFAHCYHHVGMVASIGVLGRLKMSIRRDIIREYAQQD